MAQNKNPHLRIVSGVLGCLVLVGFCLSPLATDTFVFASALGMPGSSTKALNDKWSADDDTAIPDQIQTNPTAEQTVTPSIGNWFRDLFGANPGKATVQNDNAVLKLPLTLNKSDAGGTILSECYTEIGKKTGKYLSVGKGVVRNDTKTAPDKLLSLSAVKPAFSVKSGSKDPQVLILHTHATESFDLYDCGSWSKLDTSRSTNKQLNMIAVGNAVCKQLDAAGIAYIHDTSLYDSPSYNGAYTRSRNASQAYLKKYPSIKVILDLHRDAVYMDGKRWKKFVSDIEGKKAAQIMVVTGCNDGTMDNPDWAVNLRFAAQLENRLESDWPTLTRPMYFCYRNYNQHISPGSLLIEIGTHANYLEEAVYSGELLGKSLAGLFTDGWTDLS